MAAVAAAAVIAAAGTAYAAHEQGEATDAANAANLKNQRIALAYQKELLGRAEGSTQRGIRAAEQGFDAASSAVAGVGQAARTQVTRREQVTLGRSDAEAARRGLYNSTAALNARRGIRADTSVTLAGIDEAVAQLHSGIQRDRARTLAQLHTARGSLYSRFAGLSTSAQLAYPHVAANVGGPIGQASGSLAQLLAMYGQRGDE